MNLINMDLLFGHSKRESAVGLLNFHFLQSISGIG